MRIAVLSESPADEAALRVLLDAIRGESTTPVDVHVNLRTHGWSTVRELLPSAIKFLYYQTDADGLVVLVDSDDSPLHRPEHELTGGYDPACRLCMFRGVADRALADVGTSRPDRTLRVAVALAVPAVEAWWRCGLDPHATEQGWARGLGGAPRRAARVKLKREVYGTDHPALPLETTKMVEAAHRLAKDPATLERAFPIGFGTMATAVRGWTA